MKAIRVLTLAAASLVCGAAQAADVPTANLVNTQELRVCADPADLPSSNDKGEGYENKIAELVAEELKVPVKYTWFPKATGFVRMTLGARKCDLVIGWGQGDDTVLNSNAFYRTTSVLVYKKGVGLDGVDTLADPRLKGKKIGIVIGSSGGNYVAKNGLISNIKSYPLMVDRRYENPTADMMKDVDTGEIDVAVQWGPLAGYWAKKQNPELVVVPLLKETGAGKTAFRITMGVRPGDTAWKRRLNEIIAKRQGDIDKILLDYGVPILVDDDNKMEIVSSPRPNGGVAPEEKAEAPKEAKPTVPVPASAGR